MVDLSEWHLCLVFFLFELEVKFLGQVREHDLDLRLCKRLTKADSAASMEGHPAAGVALFAGRSQTQFIAIVESLGQELGGSLPLIRVMSESFEQDAHDVTWLK